MGEKGDVVEAMEKGKAKGKAEAGESDQWSVFSDQWSVFNLSVNQFFLPRQVTSPSILSAFAFASPTFPHDP
ncbi:MAG TPA: hypothetical protein VFG54_09800 [Prolixibacteraceae bacterium]|nr:hypothetical protein [Prolixibacteraceae bacterium]